MVGKEERVDEWWVKRKGWMSGGYRVDKWWVKRKRWMTCKEVRVDEWWGKGG